jgi:hypothetical protein
MKGNVEPTLATPTSMEEALTSANRKATELAAHFQRESNEIASPKPKLEKHENRDSV